MASLLAVLLSVLGSFDFQSERASVDLMLSEWHRAAWLAEEEAYFAHFAGDDAVFMGTDATERWTAAEFRVWAHPYFERGKAWEFFAGKDRNISFNDSGDTAWFDEELVTPNMGPCRGTGVAVKRDGAWKIAHYNLSIPLPNAIVDGVVLKVAQETLGDKGMYTPREGGWHAWLETPGGRLPFRLVFQRQAGELVPFVVNAGEYTEIPRFEIDKEKHEIVLGFDHYDSVIRAEIDSNGVRMHGTWTKRRGPDEWASLPFHAAAGDQQRFPTVSRTPAERDRPFAIRQPVKFEQSGEPAIFVAREVYPTIIEATFETPTGDYRYLAGNLRGDRMQLSAFDGAHAFLFDIRIAEDGSLSGDFWSGDWWHDTFKSVADASQMPAPWDVTLASEHTPWEAHSFPDADGVAHSLAQGIDSPRLIYLFGTWCPNCADATALLKELQADYGGRGLKIVGLAFEVTGDAERDAGQVRRYAEHHGIDWPLLIAGTSKKSEASKALPFLSGVRAYPTFIFVRPGGMIEDIYTGFAGPATGATHEALKSEFREKLDAITGR